MLFTPILFRFSASRVWHRAPVMNVGTILYFHLTCSASGTSHGVFPSFWAFSFREFVWRLAQGYHSLPWLFLSRRFALVGQGRIRLFLVGN